MSNTADITANRHQGNAESVAAFNRIKPTISKQQRRVLRLFVSIFPDLFGSKELSRRPLTCKQIAEKLQVGMNHVSGRISELKRNGMIEPTGERREGCAILQITDKGVKHLTK